MFLVNHEIFLVVAPARDVGFAKAALFLAQVIGKMKM